MEKILRFIEKQFIPENLYKKTQPIYHFLMAFFSALFYDFPSKKMIVIGVTGTKGKTTTCDLIYQILNSAGYKTGLATTADFAIGDLKWQNKSKQTMLGRFELQKLLTQMTKENCIYAVIETSSEGILQFRHRFIDYNVAVFTNLSPEHIERHGSFENYRNAKIKLFEKVAEKENSIGIYNIDDENTKHFLNPPHRRTMWGIKPKIKNRYFYALNTENNRVNIQNLNVIADIKSTINGSKFSFNGEKFEMPLIGEFNVYNAAAAICVALSQNIPIETIKKALSAAKPPAGRLEIINKSQDFTVIIDYAHEPASLEAVYKTIKKSIIKNNKSKIICLLGAQGGGRDKWKRPEMGKIAGQYCDEIILTNEDPYDENPLSILEDIKKGFSQNQNSKSKIQNLYKIIDRKKAIKKSLSLAKKGDVVILTGKGGESWMCVENNQKILWDERKIVEELIDRGKLI